MPNTAQKSVVQNALTSLVKSHLDRKDFSTGSKGFFCQDKISVDGKRYQAQVMAVLIGSKQNPRAKVRATADQVQAALIADLIDRGVPARKFEKSGNTGYRAQGKVQIGDETYQASAQAVLLRK